MNSKPDLIQVVLCEPGKKACITAINNTLESLQQIVGGYIEAVYPFDDSVAIICNEEGKINGQELNRSLQDEAGNIYDILAGTFLVVGLGDEDFSSLTQEQQKKYYSLFENPETFFRIGKDLYALPIR